MWEGNKGEGRRGRDVLYNIYYKRIKFIRYKVEY